MPRIQSKFLVRQPKQIFKQLPYKIEENQILNFVEKVLFKKKKCKLVLNNF